MSATPDDDPLGNLIRELREAVQAQPDENVWERFQAACARYDTDPAYRQHIQDIIDDLGLDEEPRRTSRIMQGIADGSVALEGGNGTCAWCQRSGSLSSFYGRLFCGEECAGAYYAESGGHDA